MPKKQTKDANEKAAELVRKATDAGKVRGEDLLGSPVLKQRLRSAKERLYRLRKKGG